MANWRAMLRHGAELGDVGEAGEALAATIEARLRTGRPLAAREWIAAQEQKLARPLAPRKPGPNPKREQSDAPA